MNENPLGKESVSRLMMRFAGPSIIAMLVSAVYNIVDQLFIGRYVGTLGNAATNIAFPLPILCTAIALLFGIGGASSFNLAMGAGKQKEAAHYVGTSSVMLAVCGIVLCVLTQLFLRPMLHIFGAPQEVMAYASCYVRITAIGFPFLILTIGGGHLIRADGSPRMTMLCNLSGAVINTVLDAAFVAGFGWGMAGAAWATVIGQIFSGIMAIVYLCHFRTVKVGKEQMKLQWRYVKQPVSLGTASFFNQIAMMIVQVVLNNSLSYYGALSEYGRSIPLACSGIIMKVNQIFFAIVIGIAQGTQPIESYNYGAKQYHRVKASYWLAIVSGGALAVVFFLLFQVFPKQIIALFGEGSAQYYKFGVRFFRIFLLFTCVNFLQPITATFFTSIGKPYKGIFLSLTRQILFLLPLIVILPLFFGIEGILYAGPVADITAAVCAVVMVRMEFQLLSKEERKMSQN